jgi:hypothetical protein
MRSLSRGTVSVLVFFGFTSCVLAQVERDQTNGVSAETHRPVLTGKERLGPKWSDEQRIDNCRVPTDKRGSKERPDACPSSPSS